MTARQTWDTVLTCTGCGWSSKRTTTGLAAHALRLHSCDKQHRETATHARGIARHAAIDRTPKPCTHPHTDHEHGTYATYTLDKCRCIRCCAASSAYDTDRLRAQAYGRWDNLLPAQPAREHIARLRDAGMGTKTIAQAAGISHGALTKLLYGTTGRGPSARISKTNHAKILAIPVPGALDLADGAKVDPTGTRRRLETLIALGWSIKRLADEHHINRQALDNALRHQPVLARNARAVRDMHQTIGDRRAPELTSAERWSAARSRNLAAARGWVVPAMWDEADLDDPYAIPPTMASGRPTVDLDEWARLVRYGTNPTEAARRCGVAAKNAIGTIDALARRADRADILGLLAETRTAA